MNSLFRAGEYVVFALLLGLVAVVVWKIITREISLDGLFDSTDAQNTRSYSVERAQLLIFTLLVAGKYVLAVIQNPHRDSLPDLPVEFVAVLGGSQAIYIGGKAWSRFGPLFKKEK